MKRCLWLVVGLMVVVSACGTPSNGSSWLASPTARPDDDQRVTAVADAMLQSAPTLPPTITPSYTPPAPAATGSPTPTETPGPYEVVIESGDNCYDIAYQYGHLHPDVITAIEALNGIRCTNIRPGMTLKIPRPTPTPTPVGADLTQTAVATAAPPNMTLVTAPVISVRPYTVKAGDTLSSIAIEADSSLRQICELNPLPNGINCSGCEWQSANCCCPNPPVLSEGQQLNVPAPPPTPTVTPTFTGSETPTYTPTHRAPQPIYPLAASTVTGPVRLTWLSVGFLAENEYYLVLVRDETTGMPYSAGTRQLSLDLPADYLPNDGQPHTFAWQVVIVQLGADGLFYPLGAALPEQRFSWSGW